MDTLYNAALTFEVKRTQSKGLPPVRFRAMTHGVNVFQFFTVQQASELGMNLCRVAFEAERDDADAIEAREDAEALALIEPREVHTPHWEEPDAVSRVREDEGEHWEDPEFNPHPEFATGVDVLNNPRLHTVKEFDERVKTLQENDRVEREMDASMHAASTLGWEG